MIKPHIATPKFPVSMITLLPKFKRTKREKAVATNWTTLTISGAYNERFSSYLRKMTPDYVIIDFTPLNCCINGI